MPERRAEGSKRPFFHSEEGTGGAKMAFLKCNGLLLKKYCS